MNIEETQEKMKVMQAFVDGAEIEFLTEHGGVWAVDPSPTWGFMMKYRVKHNPKSIEALAAKAMNAFMDDIKSIVNDH